MRFPSLSLQASFQASRNSPACPTLHAYSKMQSSLLPGTSTCWLLFVSIFGLARELARAATHLLLFWCRKNCAFVVRSFPQQNKFFLTGEESTTEGLKPELGEASRSGKEIDGETIESILRGFDW
eukprot:Pompholyxophrys_punicea_v1_NODE_483_length_1859_cov_2.465632.p2 type:complete len:125 gc:universal NODE_483_length_1859_cov_2.465632:296-670(+)